MASVSPNAYLLVEGKDDLYVIAAIAEHSGLPEFRIETPKPDLTGGIDELLDGISVRLKQKNLTTLGIVVDADEEWIIQSQLHLLAGSGGFLSR